MDYPRPLNSFSAVGAGERANVRLPSANGLRYDEIHLESNVAPADIERVTVTVNADVLVDITGTELRMREAYFGNVAVTNMYTLSFREPMARTMGGTDLTSLVTQNGDNIVVEVDLASSVTNPTLKAYAITSASPVGRQVVMRIRKQSFTPSATGEQEYTTMNRGPNIKRVHIGGAAGDLDKVTIERNQAVIYELTRARNEYLLGRDGLVPQSGYFHVDPISSGFALDDMLPTLAQSFVWKFNVTTVGSLPLLAETVEAPRS